MKIERMDKKEIGNEMLPQVLNRIFSVCKADPAFPLKDKIEAIEYTIENLNKKIKAKDKLYSQAKKLHKDLKVKTDLLYNSNLKLQEKTLENLGSEL